MLLEPIGGSGVDDISHLHAPPVSVREQAAVLVDRLRHQGSTSFRSLVADAGSTIVVIERSLIPVMAIIDGLIGRRDYTPLPPALDGAEVTAAIALGYSAGIDQPLGQRMRKHRTLRVDVDICRH